MPRPCNRSRGQHDHHRKTFLYSVAETVWTERGTARTRDVCSTVETHRCEDGRHPDRGSHRPKQVEPVLSWLRQMREKAPFAALASVRLWSRSRPAGPVFRLSGLDLGSRSSHPVVCPGCHSLGRCGGAPCAEEARYTLLRVRSPTGVNVGKATSHLMRKLKGNSSMTEERLDGLST